MLRNNFQNFQQGRELGLKHLDRRILVYSFEKAVSYGLSGLLYRIFELDNCTAKPEVFGFDGKRHYRMVIG